MTDASLSDTESVPDTCQKMNRCSDDTECYEDNELHYSDEFSSDDYTDETSEYLSDDTVFVAPSLSVPPDSGIKNSTPVLHSLPPQPTLNYFCPYPKTVSQSSSLPAPASINTEECSF